MVILCMNLVRTGATRRVGNSPFAVRVNRSNSKYYPVWGAFQAVSISFMPIFSFFRHVILLFARIIDNQVKFPSDSNCPTSLEPQLLLFARSTINVVKNLCASA